MSHTVEVRVNVRVECSTLNTLNCVGHIHHALECTVPVFAIVLPRKHNPNKTAIHFEIQSWFFVCPMQDYDHNFGLIYFKVGTQFPLNIMKTNNTLGRGTYQSRWTIKKLM